MSTPGQTSHRKGAPKSPGGDELPINKSPVNKLKIPQKSSASPTPLSQRKAVDSHRGSAASGPSPATPQQSNRKMPATKLKLPSDAAKASADAGAAPSSHRREPKLSHRKADGKLSSQRAGKTGGKEGSSGKGSTSSRTQAKSPTKKTKKVRKSKEDDAGSEADGGDEADGEADGEADRLEDVGEGDETEDVEAATSATAAGAVPAPTASAPAAAKTAGEKMWEAVESVPPPLSQLPAGVPAYMHEQLQAAIQAGDHDLTEELLDCIRELARSDGGGDAAAADAMVAAMGGGEALLSGASASVSAMGAGSPEAMASRRTSTTSSYGAKKIKAGEEYVGMEINVSPECSIDLTLDIRLPESPPPAAAPVSAAIAAAAPAAAALAAAAPAAAAMAAAAPAAAGLALAKPDEVPLRKDEAAKLLAGLLVENLHKSYGRVLDLFRSWDTDRTGNVSKREFRENVLPMLRVNGEVSEADCDALFDSFDIDLSGSIECVQLFTPSLALFTPPLALFTPPLALFTPAQPTPTPRAASHPLALPPHACLHCMCPPTLLVPTSSPTCLVWQV